MHYFLVAGEASGDEHAARLISSLREVDGSASFSFVGGEKMEQASGVASIVSLHDLAVMGVIDVVRSLTKIRRAARRVETHLREHGADLVIPVDYGGFNLRYVLPLAERLGVPVVYYIPPKVWASRPGRVKQLKRQTKQCLTILPFESDYLRQHGIAATYVGNPSVQSVGEQYDSNATQCDLLHPTIALLPGSRLSEIRRNLPAMCRAVQLLPREYRAVIAQAPGLDEEIYRPYLSERISLVKGQTYRLLSTSVAAIVTSGTATLETALIGTPQVVCYRLPMGRWAKWAFRTFLPIRYFSLTNLLARREIVVELLGSDVSPSRIHAELLPLLSRSGDAYLRQQQAYAEIRTQLGTQTASRAVAEILQQYKR